MHYHPTVASKIINGCAVLYNIRKRNADLDDHNNFHDDPEEPGVIRIYEDIDNVNNGRRVRQELLDVLFN